jgi:hypothetical protein
MDGWMDGWMDEGGGEARRRRGDWLTAGGENNNGRVVS